MKSASKQKNTTMTTGFKILLTIIGCTFSSYLFAQSNILGMVVDATTQKGLKNVSVSWQYNKSGTTTNKKGEFELVAPTNTSDTLLIKHLGFTMQKIPADQALAFTSVQLQPEIQSLEGIAIETKKTSSVFDKMAGIPATSASPKRQTSNASMLNTFNNMPGVMMDERGLGGSRRLSIRGSSLRSPFGVRNVKLYWNDIPLTSPDGSTPLELIDVATIGKMEVIKGPVANIYGAVNGGSLKFYTKSYGGDRKTISLNTTFGDFGLQRYIARTHLNFEKMKVDLFYIRQNYGGYRQQEFNNKDQLVWRIAWFKNKHLLQTSGYHFDGQWGLPGAIDSTQVAMDPTQAAPFAVANNTHVDRKRTRIGLTYRYSMFNRIRWETTVYGNSTSKKNPYGTSAFFNGYKDEQAKGYGGRTQLTYHRDFLGLRNRFFAGAEYQTETNELKESANELGNPGTTLFNDSETQSTNAFGFAQADLMYYRTRTTLTLAANYGRLRYDHADRLTSDTIDFSGTRDFKAQFLPRIGLLQQLFNRKVTIHADMSYGQSAPTLWETLQQNGSMNVRLEAENALVYEIGARAGLLENGKLQTSFNVYLMTLDNAIVPSVDSLGALVYNNTGTVEQQGLEGKISYTFVKDKYTNISFAQVWGNFTLQDFKFGEYEKNGENLEGNQLTGVPSTIFNTGFNFALKNGFYLNTSLRYVGETPVNDVNSTFADAYTLLTARTGYRFFIGENWSAEVYAGGTNLLDETYSSFLQLNGFGGQYFNPSAPRSFYTGVNLNWKIK